MKNTNTTEQISVGELVIAFLERCDVRAAFGVISIHNMPLLDAIGRRDMIRFVPARSEAGAVNMADAYARVSGGLGVAVTSTGTAAGNACGAMVEALTAGTPVIHLTGQIERAYLDRNLGYIHEARDQLAMLGAVSKAAFRIRDAESALGVMREAVRIARTPPMGPVSVEIPIDVQAASIAWPSDLSALNASAAATPAREAMDALVERLAAARRPLLWAGGGARHAGGAIGRLMRLGFGVVTSVQGRGVVPEDSPQSLGAYNLQAPVEAFYQTCDALLAVGTRLRSNETLSYKLRLPTPLYRIDIDAQADQRAYPNALFIAGDSALVLDELATRLEERLKIDPGFHADLLAARQAAEKIVRDGLGPYAALVETLQRAAGRDFVWVRDITLSNSMWGNRALRIFRPRDGVHALGGGIGQGLQMAIGAAVAVERHSAAVAVERHSAAVAVERHSAAVAVERHGAAVAVERHGAAVDPDARRGKTLCLAGDGGFMVNIGELATLVQEKADVLILLMNDRGYGVIKNIQDAHYGGRHYYVDLHTPDFAALAQSIALPFHRVQALAELAGPLEAAMARRGPALIEIDMQAIGPFATAFAGPPVR